MSHTPVIQQLLDNNGLSLNSVTQALGVLASGAIDYGDLYFQRSRSESWMLEDGIIKEGHHDREQGVGVRACFQDKSGFAYSDELSLPALQAAVAAARGIVRGGQSGQLDVTPQAVSATSRYLPLDPLASLSELDKLKLLRDMEAEARRLDPAVQQVICSLAGSYEEMLVIASDGTLASDIRPLVRMNCTVIAVRNGRRERGTSGGGGRTDYRFFLADGGDGVPRHLAYAREAVRQALLNLDATDAPAGVMPVVLGSGWPGILLHEAVGHGLEGDFNRKGTSAFSGKIGQQVASTACTVIDDGTIGDRRGSLTIDDEGTPSQRTVLIENGILKGYLFDKQNARLMGTQSTGNGRRESYNHLPMPRMTNTLMLAGPHEPAEVIASIERGIYAVNFGGGQVDITSGKFVFSASEAYLVENGQIKAPIRGATLIGNGFDAMHKISMVANDMRLDGGVGVCGKEGQSVPVGVGQPTLRIDALTVGGTASG